MARIPDEALERLKREVSLARLIEGQGVKLISQGKDLACRCPWHDGDDTPSCIAAALVTQITLRLEWLDPAQCLRGIDDGDAGMTAERQQMLAIPGDDQVGLHGDCGGDDLIVIDIAGHDPRHGSGRDQFNDLEM